MAETTLMQRLLDAGYPREEMYHHETDLYIFVNEVTKPVVEGYYKECHFDRTWSAPIFRDRITGKPMYDCHFMFH